MMELDELVKLIQKLKQKKPDVYRHLIGIIKAMLA